MKDVYGVEIAHLSDFADLEVGKTYTESFVYNKINGGVTV